jgi:pimeloyl-ACP methyl ester carboxylesterase
MKLRAVALPLILLYPLYGGVMYAKQQSILFPAAASEHHALRSALPDGAQLIEMPASFGKMRAVFWPAQGSVQPMPTILYMHGNFETIEQSFATIQPLRRAGIAVLQLEYPGFGGADGEPTFTQLNEAADLAYDWLAARSGVDAQRIVVMGYSIGGGVAGALTQRRPARALILLSTFTSLEDMAHRYFLPGFLLHYPFDTLARVREFQGPVFIEHGRRDKVIPFGMGERLAGATPHAEFVALDCGHDDCRFDQGLFAERIPSWLATLGLLNRSTLEY